ncbi:MAG: PEP-CTERM sorting domain-containing protein [Bryobacterales bacterium]|nr:PEP-CTERM sorting domain-containing protein [Bryobacterales bacterium]
MTWDASNLTLVDTVDGMKFTGSLSGTFDGTNFGGPIAGVVSLHASREIAVALGTAVNVRAELTSVVTGSSSNVFFYGVGNYAALSPTAPGSGSHCFAIGQLWGTPPGVGPIPSLGSIPSTGTSCATETDPVFLTLNTTVQFIYDGLGGPGSVTIDFGNSAIAEATLVNAVPEPGTVLLMACGLGLVGLRRRGA